MPLLPVELGIKGIADLTITNQLFWLMTRQDPLQEIEHPLGPRLSAPTDLTS